MQGFEATTNNQTHIFTQELLEVTQQIKKIINISNVSW